MFRVQHWVLMLAMVCLLACSVDSDDSGTAQLAASGNQPAEGSWRARYLELGRETYQAACASCHDDGIDGAPATGDSDAWTTRSPLWAAILLEHAKSGYVNMPARGGHPELTEKAVQAAGEYMLSETFPGLLRD
jgi:cytochrome c5